MSDLNKFDQARLFYNGNFTIDGLLDKVRTLENGYDKCTYFNVFCEFVHKSNFKKDMVLFAVTLQNGLRPEDVIDQNKHYVKELLLKIRNEDLRTMRFCLGSIMPIRYYFKEEFEEYVSWFNDYVDTIIDKTDEEKRRLKYKLRY